mmetsp:Transcript_17154/g.33615  ORF Transcript_17154/g.33615 Transcript_17154/m.33615 type:complete len:151 (-) Transcript_17154:18-470(-)
MFFCPELLEFVFFGPGLFEFAFLDPDDLGFEAFVPEDFEFELLAAPDFDIGFFAVDFGVEAEAALFEFLPFGVFPGPLFPALLELLPPTEPVDVTLAATLAVSAALDLDLLRGLVGAASASEAASDASGFGLVASAFRFEDLARGIASRG